MRVSDGLIGRKLGRTVLDAYGRPLLTAGTVLTAAYVDALCKRGFSSVYVDDPLAEDIVVTEAIKEETYHRASAVVKESLDQILIGKDGTVRRIREVVDQIIRDVRDCSDLITHLSNVRCMDAHLFHHSLNVCIYAIIMGNELGYTRDDLRRLGLGSVFHDLGKLHVIGLMNKPSRLTVEEWAVMRQHPAWGFDLLIHRLRMPVEVADVALLHHEKLDGTGYPRGLKGGQIPEFAQVCAVADVFDALTTDRPYRRRLQPHRVKELLRGMVGKELNARMVEVLLRRVALFPTGSIVQLSSNELALVYSQDRHDPERPKVKVITDAEGNLTAPRYVELARRTDLEIRTVLEDLPPGVMEQIQAAKLEA